MNETVKKERLKPTVAHANLRNSIIQKYPNDSATALSSLPSLCTEKQTFTRKRKLTRPQNFDPLNPPVELYVILLCLVFV